MKVTWLGHASFMLEGTQRVYFDPYQLKSKLPNADIILITHNHFDHLSNEDIKKICDDNTNVVVPRGCSVDAKKIIQIEPNKSVEINSAIVKGIPAYNIDKTFHPKKNNWLGYVLELDGVKFYHAGDTDLIDEMANIKVDIAFLPIGGTYTMNVEQALEAAGKINAKITVPMHWGSIVGDKNDALDFIKRCPKKCHLPTPYEAWEIEL